MPRLGCMYLFLQTVKIMVDFDRYLLVIYLLYSKKYIYVLNKLKNVTIIKNVLNI